MSRPLGDEYDFSGTLTFEEYLECHTYLARGRRLWVRWVCIIYGLAMVIVGAFVLRNAPSPPFIAFGTAMVTYPVVISPFMFRYRVRKMWEGYPAIRESSKLKADSQGIIAQDDKGNPFIMTWDRMIGFRETGSLFLIYRGPKSPLCLSKRLLKEEQVAAFRKLLETVLPGEFRDRRAVPSPTAS